MRHTRFAWALSYLAVSGCATGETPTLGDGGGPTQGFSPDDCSEGALYRCEGDVAQSCSDHLALRDCADEGLVCAPGLGCVSCFPGSGSCQDGVATVCKFDGSGFVEHGCDPTQGMVCEPDGCKGACSWGQLGANYVGCDYHPTVTTNNGVWNGFDFAVVLSNVGAADANVLITKGAEELERLVVPAGELATVRLPWVMDLKGPDPNFQGQPAPPGQTKIVEQGAFRVRSDQPLAAYQFNPLDYALDPAPADCPDFAGLGCYSYSNDASLLLPAHVLGKSYYAMSWSNVGCRPGFITITALEDGTSVQLENGASLADGAGFTKDGNGKAKLDAGDVLQVLGDQQGGGFCFMSPAGDLSGTLVHADKPVQVIAGHACANLPSPEIDACDHMEETMLPNETLGKHYVVAYPQAPTEASPQTLRIGAIEDFTTIRFDPPVLEEIRISPKDGPLEITFVEDDVEIVADKPIVVAHYLHGTDANYDESVAGDPAQSMAVPIEQFRSDYTFLAPTNYPTNFVNVVAKAGSVVTVDGGAIPAESFVSVGSGEWVAARVPLSSTSGVHTAHAASPFGITVYGYGDWTSYMYPGGLKLSPIAVPPR